MTRTSSPAGQPRSSALKLVAIAGLAGILLICATTVLAVAPTVTVTVKPDPPQVGEAATFTATAADPDGLAIVTVEWDFEGNGTYAPAPASADHTFATGGAKTVGVKVTDAAGEVTEVRKDVQVNTAPKVSAIAISPREPRAGQQVSFRATSSDADGDELTTAWDVDGDRRFDDAPRRTYERAGTYAVRVRVRDGRGGEATRRRSITVAAATPPPSPTPTPTPSPTPVRPPPNNPPTALISLSPSRPALGQQVTFSAAGSSDFDGDRLTYKWETNGGSEFDDGSGLTITAAFTGVVKLRVTDTKGLSDEAQVVPVGVIATPAPGLSLMSPFPIVRIVGRARRSGTRITTLSVRAQRGATVTVSCVGRGCPRGGSSKVRSKGGLTRLRRYERYLRAGTKIAIRVSYANRIGKYTSFLIRSRVRPRRRDVCSRPGRKSPVACPGG